MKQKIKILDSKEGYDLAAATYDKKEKYLNSFEQSKLLPLLGDCQDKKILDVGAGTGRLAVELAKKGALVTALDVSEAMLEVLQRKNKKIKTVLVISHMQRVKEAADSIIEVVSTGQDSRVEA
jgi:ubiquinone/menaquinone biosynthesis C-methylase UbiE